MSSPSQSIEKSKVENIRPCEPARGMGGEPFYERPGIVLLDEKHWSYIQRRYHMSPRELEVAKLVCRGLTNGDMAKKLKVKPGTVKTHLRSVFGKTRARNKITMLLTFMDDISKFFGEYESANNTSFPLQMQRNRQPSKSTSLQIEDT